MIKKNKKASHVGMMLSFVIFITFLVFLFSILGEETKVPKEKEAFMDYLQGELLNELYANLTILRIFPPDSSEDCIKIDIRSLGLRGAKAIINGVDTKLSSNGFYLSFEWGGTSQIFDIFISDKFVGDVGSLSNCYEISENINNGDIEFIRPNKYVFENNFNILKSRYDNNYDQLKKDLDLPSNLEFGFTIKDGDRNTLIEVTEIDIIENIYSREISIQYFDNLANLKSGFIILRIW